MWNQIMVEDVSRFQSSCDDSDFSRPKLWDNSNADNCKKVVDFCNTGGMNAELHAWSHSQPVIFPPFGDLGGMLSRPGRTLSRNAEPPDIWDARGISCNVFVNPPASFSSPYPGGTLGFPTYRNTHHHM